MGLDTLKNLRDRAMLKWWYKLATLPEDRYPKQLCMVLVCDCNCTYCIGNHFYIPMVVYNLLKSVLSTRYSSICNVLCQ